MPVRHPADLVWVPAQEILSMPNCDFDGDRAVVVHVPAGLL